MNLFDVFRRKEAAGFSTEVANQKAFEIADPSSCNCAEKLGIAAPSSSPTVRTYRDPAAKKEFHKTVVNKWLDLMNEPDDSKRAGNVNTLATLQRTTPTANANHEFQNHLLSHLYGAGMSHRDLGISDSELGSQFKESQGLMQKSQTSAANQPNYNVNNCGVCNQYLTAIKSHVAKYKEHLDNASMMSTSTKPEDAGKSEDELLANIHDDFMSGNKTRSSQSSAVATAHGILGNWQKHLGNTHKYDFSSFYDPYTPVTTGKESKGFLTSLFKKNVQRLAPGWSMDKRKESPFVTENEKGQRENTLTQKRLDELSKSGEEDKIKKIVDKAKERGIARGDIYKIEPTTKNITAPKDRTNYETPGSTIKGYPATDEFSSEFESLSRGGYFTREQRGQQTYNRADDPRAGLFEEPASTGEHPEIIKPELRSGIAATLPRHHKYLFQKIGIEPDVKGLEDYAKAKRNYESQPVSTMVDTGRTETTEEPQFEEKGFVKRDGGLVPADEAYTRESRENWENLEATEKHVPSFMKKRRDWLDEWSRNSDNTLVNKKVPKLDESGKQVIKTTVKPVYEERPIPAEQRISAPSPDMLTSAITSYQSSFDGALKKAYPSLDRNQAMEALKKEHEGVVNNLEQNKATSMQTMNRRINANKENTMTIFNSGGNKKTTTIQDVKERMEALAKKNEKPCEDCGLHCADADECKKNRDDKKRQNAADNAYWND